MEKLSGRILCLSGVILIFFLFISEGLCETIGDIINNASPFAETGYNNNETSDTAAGFFAVQVGAYLKPEDADKQVIDLKSKGFDPYIFQSQNSKGQTLYAVRIGKYKTYQNAAVELTRLEQELNLPALITHYDSLVTAKAPPAAKPTITLAAETGKEPEKTPPSQKQAEVEPVHKTVEPATETPETEATLQERISSLEEAVKKLREEAEVRKKLQMTEEEKSQQEQEQDVLEAAGREYTLTGAGNIKFTYGVSYGYSEYDAVRQSVRIEDVANHTISNSLNVSYGVKDNLTLSAGIPFVYKYHRVGTIDSKSATGLGNLSLNWRWQPMKTGSGIPTIIINGGFSNPVGKGPYDIQVGEELSTSSGIYSTSLGVSVSQVSDPVVVFSSLTVNYPFTTTNINQKRSEGVLDKVDPGISIGTGAGMGYALSYKLNLNMSFSYSYSFETKYYYKDAPEATTGTGTSASLNLGVGYKFRQNQNLNFRIGIPITTSRAFTFSFSTPIEFEM